MASSEAWLECERLGEFRAESVVNLQSTDLTATDSIMKVL